MTTQKPRIIISISKLGETEIEVVGSQGKSCLSLTDALTTALGTVTDVEFKPEFREADTVVVQQLRQRS